MSAQSLVCSALVKSTGLPCTNKAKTDGKCGVHNRTPKAQKTPVGPIEKCCATVKSTGLPCKNKTKTDGKCGVHNRTKKVKIVVSKPKSTVVDFNTVADKFADDTMAQALVECC